MSDRRRYLITYDIADDRRRDRVFAVCGQHGDHTQFSVFMADLSDRELVRFRAALEQLVQCDQDQVLIADLGPANEDCGRIIASVGRPYAPPVRAIVI